MLTARIIGTGSSFPETVIDNFQLSRRIPDWNEKTAPKGFKIQYWKEKLSKEGTDVTNWSREQLFSDWTIKMTGIEKRHIYNNIFDSIENFKSCTEVMGADAARRALDMAGIKSSNLDCIITSTFTPSIVVPNAAATIGNMLGINEGYESVTINTACTGFIQGLVEAYDKIRSRDYKNVLVIASETLSKVTNYNDAKTAVLFSDGAAAAVLKAERVGLLSRIPGRFFKKFYRKGILGYCLDTRYSKDNIALEDDLGYVTMEGGPEVLRKAVKAMKDAAIIALERANLSIEDIAYLVSHQANQRMTLELTTRLGLPAERVVDTIRDYGNTSAASVGIALDKTIRGEVKNYKVNSGDILELVAVGGGYTLAAMVLEY